MYSSARGWPAARAEIDIGIALTAGFEVAERFVGPVIDTFTADEGTKPIAELMKRELFGRDEHGENSRKDSAFG